MIKKYVVASDISSGVPIIITRQNYQKNKAGRYEPIASFDDIKQADDCCKYIQRVGEKDNFSLNAINKKIQKGNGKIYGKRRKNEGIYNSKRIKNRQNNHTHLKQISSIFARYI